MCVSIANLTRHLENNSENECGMKIEATRLVRRTEDFSHTKCGRKKLKNHFNLPQ